MEVPEKAVVRKTTPPGILRLEMARPSKLPLELRIQVEPTSPQPSIDRLSVTFADDSELSTKINYFNPHKMDKMHFPPVSDGEESDPEDYSASVNAIIQRKASTRRSKRRSGRRTSSPLDRAGMESIRRRSSVYTTSSGDTAITVDENLAPEVTQEEIFENIKLHKEVLSNVKMQPWNMRKKLKLVVQAKAYIKKHEGALQERLAQSHSTRDMLARWHILLIKRWQRWQREMVNLSMWFIPWEAKIKEIESHFGSVVASYFIFLRWLFWVNIVISVVLISFVVIPEIMLWLLSVVVLCELRINSALIYGGKPYQYSPPENDVGFYLYHRSNSSHGHPIIIGNQSSLDYSPFDPEIATVILIHGWTHGKDVPWMKEVSKTMAESGYWNVIVLDWAALSHCIYAEARVHATVVGKQLTRFILFLVDNASVNLEMVHLVGHSMGAHMAGDAGRQCWKKIGKKVGRITGLDAAAPLYEWPHIESMDDLLDREDANFVDAIHTNSRHLGVVSPVGHVDFYPNGGEFQPGCALWVCSHMRAVEYWIASLSQPDLFKAYPYEAYNRLLVYGGPPPTAYPMGVAANPDMPLGVYYVETAFEYQRYVHSRTSIIDSLV